MLHTGARSPFLLLFSLNGKQESREAIFPFSKHHAVPPLPTTVHRNPRNPPNSLWLSASVGVAARPLRLWSPTLRRPRRVAAASSLDTHPPPPRTLASPAPARPLLSGPAPGLGKSVLPSLTYQNEMQCLLAGIGRASHNNHVWSSFMY
ncbi:unnamed protein product [Urochloa humidicola]